MSGHTLLSRYTGEEGQRTNGTLEGDFEAVVFRIAHVFVVGIGADLVGEWPTRSVDDRAVLAGEDEVLLKRAAGRRAGRRPTAD